MKNIKFILFFFLLAGGIFTYGQTNVAHIDRQKLVSEMPEFIAAQKQLEKLQKTYATELESTMKEFQSKMENYSADQANQTDVTNQARQKELESMQQNITQYRQTAAEDLQKKQLDLMEPILEKADNAITKVAKEKGFSYVLDASEGGSVIVAAGTDLTTAVKQELGVDN